MYVRKNVTLGVVLGAVVCASSCDISAQCLPWLAGVNDALYDGDPQRAVEAQLSCAVSGLGNQCSSNPDTLARVTVRDGSNDVVADPAFENCDDFYCASTNGSRPYCTRRCETDFDCNPGGLPCIPGRECERDFWSCQVVIEFGALACKQVDPATGSCETDPATGKVSDPVKYCRVADGHIEKGTQAAAPDAGM